MNKPKLKPGDIWHKTAVTKITYEPEAKDPYRDKTVLQIYKKDKHD